MDAATLLPRLIRIPTLPDERRESEAARLLAEEARACGLAARIHEPVLGAGSVEIRLPGSCPESLLLHAHLDVAPVGDPAAWSVPPFGGIVTEGAIWGRGAVDAKGLVAAFFEVMTRVARAGPVRRGLVLVATAGEEGGRHNGLAWLMEQGKLRDCRWALGEGGGFPLRTRRRELVLVQTAERGALEAAWAAHAMPVPLRARDRRYERDLRKAVADASGLLGWVEGLAPGLIWRGTRVDVGTLGLHLVEVDRTLGRITCRIMPGETTAEVAARLGLKPDSVSRQVEPNQGGAQGPLWEAVSAAVAAWRPGAVVAPYCTPGFSDHRHLRWAGVESLGFFPLPPAEVARQHQVDERIGLGSLAEATEVLENTVRRFVELGP